MQLCFIIKSIHRKYQVSINRKASAGFVFLLDGDEMKMGRFFLLIK